MDDEIGGGGVNQKGRIRPRQPSQRRSPASWCVALGCFISLVLSAATVSAAFAKDIIVRGELEYTGYAHEQLYGSSQGSTCPGPGTPCVSGVFGTEDVSVS